MYVLSNFSATPELVSAPATSQQDQAANEAQASASVALDPSQPVTNIQIRLADGGKLVQKFNHTHRWPSRSLGIRMKLVSSGCYTSVGVNCRLACRDQLNCCRDHHLSFILKLLQMLKEVRQYVEHVVNSASNLINLLINNGLQWWKARPVLKPRSSSAEVGMLTS